LLQLEESMADEEKYVIGQNIYVKATSLVDVLERWCDEQFLWIDEVLAEAKKTMAV